MTVAVKTSGLHHISLRTSDLARAVGFYRDVLGFRAVVQTEELCLVQAGASLIGLRAPTGDTRPGDRFDPFRVGMDHVALGCDSLEELRRVSGALDQAGVWNTGVKEESAVAAHYVAFKDPDGIKLELWLDG